MLIRLKFLKNLDIPETRHKAKMEADTRKDCHTVFKLQIMMFIFIVYLSVREILV